MHSDSPQGSAFEQAFSPAQHANQEVLKQQAEKDKKKEAAAKKKQQQKEIKYKKEVLKQQAEKDKNTEAVAKKKQQQKERDMKIYLTALEKYTRSKKYKKLVRQAALQRFRLYKMKKEYHEIVALLKQAIKRCENYDGNAHQQDLLCHSFMKACNAIKWKKMKPQGQQPISSCAGPISSCAGE